MLHGRKFHRTRTLIVGVSVCLGIGVLGTLPAHATPVAPPTPPSTSSDAKVAWRNSSHLAEIASEQVNGAKQAQIKSEQVARQAASDLAAAKNRATSAQNASATAIAAVAGYQTKLDAFANASFRGVHLSQFSVMLTARSADDFLDESTVVNRVAQDTQQTLDAAIAAKNTAAVARSQAEVAEAAAGTAKSQADQAAAAARAATVTATSKKAALDAAVVTYKGLYDQLSAREKAAAASAAEQIRQDSIRLAAAIAARSQADAAAAKQDAAVSSFSSSSSASAQIPVQAAVSSSTQATATGSSTPSASGSATSGNAAGDAAAAAALTKVGFSYVYGATGPDAFDCSGLTSWAWAQQGIGIPRASYEQANFPEVPLDQLQPGDLVTYYSPVSHVAIYVGNGMVVSAADEQLGVVLRSVDGAGPDASGHRVPRG
jgi:cell wall-associated NlpC family hydrolase